VREGEITMEHFWRSLPGFFTWPDYYSWAARQFVFRKNWRFVEVGAYGGQSVAYLAVEMKNLGCSRVKIDLVDRFTEIPVETVRKSLAPVADLIGDYHACDSWDGAKKYQDKSLDFVFIDADHGYDSVHRDIAAWLPKIRRGGIIAGHDFCPDFPGVIRAVTEAFPRVDLWRGERGPGWGDQRMVDTRLYYSVWSVEV
jgi:Methyltransferase domain